VVDLKCEVGHKTERQCKSWLFFVLIFCECRSIIYSYQRDEGNGKMKPSKANAIINKNLKGVFMQSVIKSKGWSQLEARSRLVEFVTTNHGLSLKEFMDLK
jgi:hypothetical protein